MRFFGFLHLGHKKKDSDKIDHMVYELSNSSESQYIGSNDYWAYNISKFPFADDISIWNTGSKVEIMQHAKTQKMHDFLSDCCVKIQNKISNARNVRQNMDCDERKHMFDEGMIYAKKVLSLGHKEAINILKDIFGNGLKIGRQTLIKSDSLELSFWQEVERKLTFADGYKAGYTNNTSMEAAARTATFIISSAKVHNGKIIDAIGSFPHFISNFDQVTQGGLISEEVINYYQKGLIRNLVGEGDNIFTE